MSGAPRGGALDWRTEPGAPATVQAPELADAAEARAWLADHHDDLRAGLHRHGAVYLRGLPVRSVEDFALVRDELIPRATPYREKATPRSDFGGGVFSSTDLPAGQAIRPHNENSYTLTFPGLLLFGCLTAPEEGGATPVADCREVLRTLPAELVERMRASGWILTRTYSESLSVAWQSAFGTESPEQVEKYCAENHISCAWDADGRLRTSQLRPGVVRHPHTGEDVWFNHLAFWSRFSLDDEIREVLLDELGPDGLPFDTGIDDGIPLTAADLESINTAYENATVRRAWQPGDLLLVDNVLTAHARDPFRGERRIVVAMGEPVSVYDCAPIVAPRATAATAVSHG
ncbi:alpha-ketoglutarate-dependent taurine dioxygenase [Streptomyces sp. 1114.5]|uniref:TauD/TfdA family dioxygenase n=1 Tax=Streptomyces sp. 1114.5 TaxID=1938830 RepID=UPI000EADDCE3|nr:TauD/TfdA family dioxygenase [Streptomyces sp. 1114.5]RKT19470.1 alpha-ketoglutarate-dependent taurine dioxygenase [Streptomyces sp. 1114.5]